MGTAVDTRSATGTAHIRAPALLRALDHVLHTDTGWIAQCPVFGCTAMLTIEPDHEAGHWRLRCDGEHSESDVVDYLHCDTSLDQGHLRRVWRAMVLSPRLAVCEALLERQPVPRSALDPLWVRRLGI